MSDSPKARYASASADVQSLATPPRWPNRSHNRPPARAVVEPYSLPTSQLKPTTAESFSLRSKRQRCVSAGSATTSKIFYPDLNLDAATPAQEKQKRRVVSASSLLTPEPSEDGAVSESKKSPGRPRLSTPSKSAPALPLTPKTKDDEAGLYRPKMPRQTKSAPAKITALKIHQRIVDQLKKPLTRKECTDQALGNNYIFETIVANSPGKKVMKIGRTKTSEWVRLSTISKICDHARIEKQDDPEKKAIRLYGRAEILMHKELEDFRYEFSCRCKKVKAHREYFDIDKDVALDVVQRWRRFCEQEPYGEDGYLKPFWEQRLRNTTCSDKPEDELDHWSRAERWDKFTNPDRLELVLFDIYSINGKIWRRRWETIALGQSIYILILTFPSFYTVLCCIAICFGIMMELGEFEWPMLFSIFKGARNASRKRAISKSRKGAVDTSTAVTECKDSPSAIEEPEEEDEEEEEVSYIEIEESDPSGEEEDGDDGILPVHNEEEPDTISLEDTSSETSEEVSLVSEDPSR